MGSPGSSHPVLAPARVQVTDFFKDMIFSLEITFGFISRSVLKVLDTLKELFGLVP